jgi:hypothetical protein
MKILFLDFDGVLNSGESFHENHEARLRAEERGDDPIGIMVEHGWPLGHICPKNVECLNYIVEQTGCSIVVSSVWRSHELDELRGWLKTRGFRYPDMVIGRTANFQVSACRGYEIHDWLNKSENVNSFVIIDDDCDMYHLMPYLVNTDGRVGLTMEKAKVAVDLLNENISEVPQWKELAGVWEAWHPGDIFDTNEDSEGMGN